MPDEDHILIAGGGRVGRRVAKRFADRGKSVTVIEKNPDGIGDEETDFEVITGDGTRPSVLDAALRPETSTIGALTNREDTNLAVCLVAKQIDQELRTVARIEDECGDEYADFVDQVFFPERASIKAAVNALSGSNIRTLEDVTGDLEILDIQVGYDAPIKGEELSAIDFPEGAQVISRTNGHVAAQADEKLVGGRRYLVAADSHVVNDVIDLFRGEPE
ncbi:MAG: TrkA family potassium uptake protein [Halodesulfurarchaeum sp.]|nr:TrkA family potassium uptake protein [Halodesulfurarchaeum sp.]